MYKRKASISIGIPCHNLHVGYLQELIDCYNSQTIQPSEIIISISEYKKSLKLNSKVPLNIITTKKRNFAGINRNIIMRENNSDFVMFNDADDLPHIKRVEIVQNAIAKKRKVNVLLHSYLASNKSKNSFNNLKISKENFLNLNLEINNLKLQKYKKLSFDKNLTHGAIIVDKEVGKLVKWSSKPKGQDVEFVENCITNGVNVYSINIPLYFYQNELSSKAENF